MTYVYNHNIATQVTTLAQRIMQTNLCKEILLGDTEITRTMNFKFPPESKYKFSRAKWYEASYGNHDVIEVFDWCEEHFGQCPEHQDAWCRWYSDRPWKTIKFRDEKDYNWYVLRWGA